MSLLQTNPSRFIQFDQVLLIINDEYKNEYTMRTSVQYLYASYCVQSTKIRLVADRKWELSLFWLYVSVQYWLVNNVFYLVWFLFYCSLACLFQGDYQQRGNFHHQFCAVNTSSSNFVPKDNEESFTFLHWIFVYHNHILNRLLDTFQLYLLNRNFILF